MISVVIPVLKNGDNTELRYTLRSIEKHLKGYGEVFLIGHKPDWCKNVIHIPFTDNPDKKRKEFNIHSKLLIACNHPSVSENFLYFTDDTYLLQDFEASTFPAYYKHELYETMKKNCGTYRASCNHSRKILLAKGLPTKDFDVHSPHLLNKNRYVENLSGLDWTIDYGYVIKSLALAGSEGVQISDCKVRKSPVREIFKRLKGRSFFSTSNDCKEIVEVLQSLYQTSSKYES